MALNLNTAAEGRVGGEDANIVTEALFQTAGLVKVQDFSIDAAPTPQQPAANAAPAGPGGSRPARKAKTGTATEKAAAEKTEHVTDDTTGA